MNNTIVYVTLILMLIVVPALAIYAVYRFQHSQPQKKNLQATTMDNNSLSSIAYKNFLVSAWSSLIILSFVVLLNIGWWFTPKEAGSGDYLLFLIPLMPLGVWLPVHTIRRAKKGFEKYKTDSWRKAYTMARIIFTIVGLIVVLGPFLSLSN